MALRFAIGGLRLVRRSCMPALAGCLLAASLCFADGAASTPDRPSEYDVRAAYLLNFGKFMRLNGEAQTPDGSFHICILGHDPIGAVIDQLAAGDTIDRRPIHIQRIGDPTQGLGCQVLYIGPSETGRLREDLAILEGSDILTVGDAPDFLQMGGMVQFILDSDHVRFKVNLNAVNRTHIVLSSELLRVAAAVEGNPNRGGAR